MNKIVKALFIIEIILIVITLTLVQGAKTPTTYAIKNPSKKIDFKISTKAVCEEKTDHIFCHDELFVKCNNEEYMVKNLNNSIKCDDINLKLPDINVNGYAKFTKDWIDPRTLGE